MKNPINMGGKTAFPKIFTQNAIFAAKRTDLTSNGEHLTVLDKDLEEFASYEGTAFTQHDADGLQLILALKWACRDNATRNVVTIPKKLVNAAIGRGPDSKQAFQNSMEKFKSMKVTAAVECRATGAWADQWKVFEKFEETKNSYLIETSKPFDIATSSDSREGYTLVTNKCLTLKTALAKSLCRYLSNFVGLKPYGQSVEKLKERAGLKEMPDFKFRFQLKKALEELQGIELIKSFEINKNLVNVEMYQA